MHVLIVEKYTKHVKEFFYSRESGNTKLTAAVGDENKEAKRKIPRDGGFNPEGV